MTKERIPEICFYEWSLTRWMSSSTRAMLDAKGRGIYRELLDRCYAQGDIPADIAILAKICACTVADIEEIWPILKRHFTLKKHDATKRENRFANVERRTFFSYIAGQKAKGKLGGRPKANKNNEIETKPFKTEKPNRKEEKGIERKRIEKQEKEISRAPNFVPDWDRAKASYPGMSTQMDCQLFFSIIDTPEEQERFFAGIEAWHHSGQFQRGKVFAMKRFLSERIYLEAPPAEAPIETATERRIREESERITAESAARNRKPADWCEPDRRCLTCSGKGEVLRPVPDGPTFRYRCPCTTENPSAKAALLAAIERHETVTA